MDDFSGACVSVYLLASSALHAFNERRLLSRRAETYANIHAQIQMGTWELKNRETYKTSSAFLAAKDSYANALFIEGQETIRKCAQYPGRYKAFTPTRRCPFLMPRFALPFIPR